MAATPGFKKLNTQIHTIHIEVIRTIINHQLKQLQTESLDSSCFTRDLKIVRVTRFCRVKSVCRLFQAKGTENLKAFFPNSVCTLGTTYCTSQATEGCASHPLRLKEKKGNPESCPE